MGKVNREQTNKKLWKMPELAGQFQDPNSKYEFPNLKVDQFPFLGGEDCKPGVKGEEEDWGPSPQVAKILASQLSVVQHLLI